MPLVCHAASVSPSGSPRRAPDAPPTFDEGYVLPVHDTSMPLTVENAHPLDARLTFLEEPHVYLLDGTAVSCSVTTLAHKYQAPFDAAAAVHAMKVSRKEAWPRLKYTVGAQRLDDDAHVPRRRGLLLATRERTIAVMHAHQVAECEGDDATLLKMLWLLAPHDVDECDEVGVYSFVREMTQREIVAEWERNGLEARNRGTEAHLQMQLAVEGRPFRAQDAEVVVGMSFLDRFPGDEWVGYRCEWEIVHPQADVAGSIDLVVQHKHTGDVIIVDYKRSDKLRAKLRGYKPMRAPMNHLDDCDGATYALQLSIYQYILETIYGLRVVDRILISVHPDAPFATSVPNLAAEVKHIFDTRIHDVAVHRNCPYRCFASGKPLTDPVLVEGSEETFDRAAARALGHTIRDADLATASLVSEWLESEECASLGVPKFPTTWKQLMPKDGIAPSVWTVA